MTLPLPVTGDVLAEIHSGRPVTVHVQPDGAVTLTVKEAPAPESTGLLVGEIVAAAQGLAACVTECVAPAITGVALRAAPLLAATV